MTDLISSNRSPAALSAFPASRFMLSFFIGRTFDNAQQAIPAAAPAAAPFAIDFQFIYHSPY